MRAVKDAKGPSRTTDRGPLVAVPDVPTTDRAEGAARPPLVLSKSLMANPCQRKGWYSEHVRLDGHKLRFPMPEKVIFGSAVDAAHLEIVWAAKEGKEPDLALAVEKGMALAKRKDTSDEINWAVFEVQVRNAMTLFLRQPEGLARIPLEGIRFQGIDGGKIVAGDLVGYPDYSWPDGSLMDVKTSGNGKYSESRFWRSPEMPTYALIQTFQEGVVPPALRYQVYVRNVKPYWQWIEISGTALIVSLGRYHAEHWRVLLDGPVDAAAFDVTYCGDCGFREAIPEANHEGCPIGQSVPLMEEAA